MMRSQILIFVDFTKQQKPRYLKNETVLFFFQKNSSITHQGLCYSKKSQTSEERGPHLRISF